MTEVAINGASGSTRTTVRELQLRAQQPGALLIGPVRARQGGSVVATDPILVTVDSAADRTALTLSPLARSLLETTPAPISRRADRVALTMLVPSDTVFAGQQVDVIAAAWIPRDLDQRMRRPPFLTLVTPEGVWAYPAATSSGVALSRQVSGRWIDLFIAHQVVFPLTPGRLIIPPASVEYALPVTFSFFSREERYTLRSDSIAITVLQLPPHNPTTNVVGDSLSLDLQVDPATTRVGEPLEASVTVTGIGNVALWPEPVLRWPTGFRVYPAQTEVRVAPVAGWIAGAKTFHFLAVPDSAGNFKLPEVRYLYFNATARGGRGPRYETAISSPQAVAVAPGAEPRAARVLPPLLPTRGELFSERLGRRLGREGWLLVLFVPPLIAWLARRRRADRNAPAARGGDDARDCSGRGAACCAAAGPNRPGPDRQRGGIIRGWGAARCRRFVRRARHPRPAGSGALVQSRRHAVSRRRGRQGHRGVDSRGAPRAARSGDSAGAAAAAGTGSRDRAAPAGRLGDAIRMGIPGRGELAGPVARGRRGGAPPRAARADRRGCGGGRWSGRDRVAAAESAGRGGDRGRGTGPSRAVRRGERGDDTAARWCAPGWP